MKSLLALALILSSVSAFAAQKSVALDPSEIQSLIKVFDEVGIKAHASHAVCFETSAEITLQSGTLRKGYAFEPDDLGMIAIGSGFSMIVDDEKAEAKALFERAGVPELQVGSALRKTATIRQLSCEMGPASWTINFDDGKN